MQGDIGEKETIRTTGNLLALQKLLLTLLNWMSGFVVGAGKAADIHRNCCHATLFAEESTVDFNRAAIFLLADENDIVSGSRETLIRPMSA